MRKTDRKLDNAISAALTEACELALEEFDGFSWLTHQVNYQRFPESLRLVCVFEHDAQIATLREAGRDAALQRMLVAALDEVGVKLQSPAKNVHFDSEEACARDNAGNWAKRLA